MRSKSLKSTTRPPRPHPYRSIATTSSVDPWPTRATSPIPDMPPPPPSFNREMSMIGFLEKKMKEKFPSFVWKHDIEIVIASSPSYQPPMDNATLRRRLDDDINIQFRDPRRTREEAVKAIHSAVLMMRNTPRTEIHGVKPFDGQQTRSHLIPSCPSVSVRLWTSSPSLKHFCMDFVDTVTGTSVGGSDRFKAYGGSYMVSGGPTMQIRPLSQAGSLPGGRFEGETYILNEGQTVTIEDTKSKHRGADRFLSFKVPKYPGGTPSYPVQVGHTAHFSFDE